MSQTRNGEKASLTIKACSEINRAMRLILLRAAGILLIALGIVHLTATPHIAALIRQTANPRSVQWLTPSMLLNHILVGVLLLPLGFLTLYAAPYAISGSAWAKMTVRVNAVSVATYRSFSSC
jgi:hypothetical protein